jgi:hypothetical protein
MAAAIGFGSATAATTTRDFGYVDPSETVYEATGWSYTVANEQAYVIKIPAATLATYGGGTVKALKFGWCSRTAGKVTAIVRSGAIDSETVASQDATVKFGWNTITFSEPYTLPNPPEDLYVGVRLTMPVNEYCVATGTYSAILKGVNFTTDYAVNDYYGGAEIWEDLYPYDTNAGNLMMLAVVEYDADAHLNELAITDIRYSNVALAGEYGTAKMTFVNEGSNNVNSLTVSYSIDGETKYKNLSLTDPITPGSTKDVAMPLLALGTGTMTVGVSHVNAKPNNITSSLDINMLAIPDYVAEKYVKRPVAEYYGSESEHYTPGSMYFPAFIEGLDSYGDAISMVAHHLDDKFSVGDDEDTQLMLDMVDNDSSLVYLPMMTIDRCNQVNNLSPMSGTPAFFVLQPGFVNYAYDEALAVPTLASVNIDGTYDAATHTGSLTISGTIEPDVLPADEKLWLTTYIVEDSVATDSQEFPSSDKILEMYPDGIFYHSGVIRVQPCDIHGEEMAEGDYSVTYPFELDEDWNWLNMRVVAFLQRPQTNDKFDRNIINSGERRLSAVASISEITADEALDNAQEIYNIGGQRLSRRPTTPGIYLVRSGNQAQKVVIR